MIITSLLLANILLASASLNGYCDKEGKCTKDDNSLHNQQKLLFYDVNPSEGFNLRRDVYMRLAIMLAEAKNTGRKTNWNLVLPPWYNLYHWKFQSEEPKPWFTYFDLASLKSYAPVLELYEVFPEVTDEKSPSEYVIDTLYVLQNYENAFENGVFDEKWDIVGPCDYEGFYWGYHNITAKETLCVKFQGKISQIWDLISSHPWDSRVMIAHAEIPLHDTYGTRSFWDCRISMRFNRDLVGVAETYMSTHLKCKTRKCPNYISVHWRRQDFARYRANDIPSIKGTAKQIDQAVRKHKLRTNIVFIATDALDSEALKLEKELYKYGHKAYFFKPNDDIDEFNEGQAAVIEQIICSRSAYFIGTHESTFTFRIQEEREILGFDSITTFNRLCPDRGDCEKPSKWTIVH